MSCFTETDRHIITPVQREAFMISFMLENYELADSKDQQLIDDVIFSVWGGQEDLLAHAVTMLGWVCLGGYYHNPNYADSANVSWTLRQVINHLRGEEV